MGGGAWHALLLVDTAAYDSIAPHSNNRKLSTKPGRNTGVSLYHYGMDGRHRPIRPVKQENRGSRSGHSSLPPPEARDFSRAVVHSHRISHFAVFEFADSEPSILAVCHSARGGIKYSSPPGFSRGEIHYGAKLSRGPEIGS